MNNAAKNTHVQVSGHMFSFLLSRQEWNLWVIWQIYVLFFKETSKLFYKTASSFSPTIYEGSYFFISSPTFVIVFLLNPTGCEIVSHCGFRLHFLNNGAENLFMCLFAIHGFWWDAHSHLQEGVSSVVFFPSRLSDALRYSSFTVHFNRYLFRLINSLLTGTTQRQAVPVARLSRLPWTCVAPAVGAGRFRQSGGARRESLGCGGSTAGPSVLSPSPEMPLWALVRELAPGSWLPHACLISRGVILCSSAPSSFSLWPVLQNWKNTQISVFLRECGSRTMSPSWSNKI